MKSLLICALFIHLIKINACVAANEQKPVAENTGQQTIDSAAAPAVIQPVPVIIAIDSTLPKGQLIDTKNTDPDEVTAYAETLIGVPYQYASIDPNIGFDCSGFITHVFNHFNIKVPRSSIEFTNVGEEVPLSNVKRGDIILFTGTDSTERFVGHMGLIVSNQNGEVQFIHSSSGKAKGVTITPLNEYYKGRYMKSIRVFKQNNNR